MILYIGTLKTQYNIIAEYNANVIPSALYNDIHYNVI